MPNKKPIEKSTISRDLKWNKTSKLIKNRFFINLLVFILSLFPYAVNASKTGNQDEKNNSTILQKIKELCNKYPKKVDKSHKCQTNI